MTPFQAIVVKARDGALSDGLSAGYFGGKAFEDRLRFEGAQGVRDKVMVALTMLEMVALDPRGVEQCIEHLGGGCVVLTFMGICNPVGMFEVGVGSDELLQVKAAVRRNLESDMYKAAQRVLAWRSSEKVAARLNQESAVVERFRASLDWPVMDRSKLDQSAWRDRHDMLLGKVGSKRAEVRERRVRRLGRLSRATAPDVGGWYELLEAIAQKALGCGPVGSALAPA